MRPNEAVIATAFDRLSPLRAEMPPSVNQLLASFGPEYRGRSPIKRGETRVTC
jgi:hypothetical protein